MSYDEALAERIRACLDGVVPYVEKKMFGGLGFMVEGNMAVAASGQGGLLARVDPGRAADWLADGVEPMIMQRRPMNGWLRVADEAVAEDDALQEWVDRCLEFVATLPPK